jgi:hypothetical protein
MIPPFNRQSFSPLFSTSAEIELLIENIDTLKNLLLGPGPSEQDPLGLNN